MHVMMATNNQTQRIRTVSVGLLLTAGVLLAHQYLPDNISDLSHQLIRSLHGPGFGLVALLIMIVMRNPERPLVAYIKAAAFSMILAGVAEASQILGPRSPQISDLLTDALGIYKDLLRVVTDPGQIMSLERKIQDLWLREQGLDGG